MKKNKKIVTIFLIVLIIILVIIGILHYSFVYNKTPKRYVKNLDAITSGNITLNLINSVGTKSVLILFF